MKTFRTLLSEIKKSTLHSYLTKASTTDKVVSDKQGVRIQKLSPNKKRIRAKGIERAFMKLHKD
jgi:hypothetical protein